MKAQEQRTLSLRSFLALCFSTLFLSSCAGVYVEAEHVSNIYCGDKPFGNQCRETDWNSLGVGYRHSFDNGIYLDAKFADQIGTRELEGKGPHAYWKAGYQF